MKTATIVTLGCKTNQFESAAILEQLMGAGYRHVSFEEGADLVIVNTCTVTAATDAQSRNLIRRARRLNPSARVIVTGCYAQVNPEDLRSIPGVSLILGNEEKRRLLQFLPEENTVHVSDIRQARDAAVPILSTFEERSRAFVQIQNGCDAFCSYCIIPYARGRSRSVPAEDVIDQVNRLVASGYPEVVLTGIHIGGYGSDLNPSTSLNALVRRIERETDIGRLRLGSMEPMEIPEALIDFVADSRVVCPHFHIPLQSGDDQVLRRMNRHYSGAFFQDLVRYIHQRIPQAAIGIDLIAGFPGETESEFRNTLELLRQLPVSHLHVFPFSRRPGTPAAEMPSQVRGDLIKERAAQLRELGAEKLRSFSRRFIGHTVEIVVEGGGKGLTRNYLSVELENTTALPGTILQVRITETGEGGLRGVTL